MITIPINDEHNNYIFIRYNNDEINHMTTTFSLSQTNDIFIGSDGNLSLSSGLQAVLFACKNAAQTILGEMILATDQGLPNFQVLWNGSPNVPQFEAALREAINNVDGVQEISDLVFSFSDNVLFYRITIVTIYGSGAINGRV